MTAKLRAARRALYAAAQACEAAGVTFAFQTGELEGVRRGACVLPELLAVLDRKVEK